MSAHEEREEMLRAQILARGILDARVAAAMRAVPREEFVPEDDRERAYADGPLPIGEGQTISQPYVVAAMLAALGLEGAERVLEVGAGSGYAAAVLARLCREVWAVERLPSLADECAARIARLGIDNVHVLSGDGTLGLLAHAPYEAILVSAGGPRIPQPLLDQLAPGGRLVMPLGPGEDFDGEQRLVKVERTESGLRMTSLEPVRFVPLIGG